MDCCNYLQPYYYAQQQAGLQHHHHQLQQQQLHHHHLQQQQLQHQQHQQYCYEYGAAYGGGAAAPPIEASPRYGSCRLPPAYPTGRYTPRAEPDRCAPGPRAPCFGPQRRARADCTCGGARGTCE